mmetsp:Transcript_16230/g.52877  ORF Transcript_16230/g.52877 Transcript_16230/m.52877 type:complete len:494 (-) Transcript_16230:1283-2764(-)
MRKRASAHIESARTRAHRAKTTPNTIRASSSRDERRRLPKVTTRSWPSSLRTLHVHCIRPPARPPHGEANALIELCTPLSSVQLRPTVPILPRICRRELLVGRQQSDAYAQIRLARRCSRGRASKESRDNALAGRGRLRRRNVDQDGRTILGMLVADEQLSERVEHKVADGAADRPRPVSRIVPRVSQAEDGLLADPEPHAALRQATAHLLQLHLGDLGHAVAREAVEEDDFVESVDKLGRVSGGHSLEHLGPRLLGGGAFGQGGQGICPEVGRHDDERIAEVDLLALRIGQPPLVHNLQQQRSHLPVGLLELVEQQDRVRPPAHRLRQLAPLVVADVSRRRPDQPRDSVPLRKLGHVEPRDGVGGVEEEVSQRFAQVRFADTSGSDQHECAQRPVGRLQPRARDAHRVGHDGERLVLTNDCLGQGRFHFEQPLALGRHQAGRWDAGGARHHLGDVGGRDLLRQEGVVAVVAAGSAPRRIAPLRKLLFEARDD